MEGYDYKLAYDYMEMFRGFLADFPNFSAGRQGKEGEEGRGHVRPAGEPWEDSKEEGLPAGRRVD